MKHGSNAACQIPRFLKAQLAIVLALLALGAVPSCEGREELEETLSVARLPLRFVHELRLTYPKNLRFQSLPMP